MLDAQTLSVLETPPDAASLDADQAALQEKSHLLTQLQLLTRVLGAGAGTLDLSHLLGVAIRELDRHLPFCVSSVWVVEEPPGPNETDSEEPAVGTPSFLVLQKRSTTSGSWIDELGLIAGTRLPVPETPVARAFLEGRALYADWRRPEERGCPLADRLAAHGATASFAAPLRCGDRTAGVLQSICRRAGGFTREQIQLLHLVASLLGPAISTV